MNRVLLIFEDYQELNTLEFTLKKVGFDCVGITSEFSVSEKVLSFNPDIVIACGKGPKVSTVGVGRRLKEMPRWSGKSVLIFPAGVKPKPEELIKIRMDMVLEAPVQNVRMVQVLAKLTNQDDQVLIEKLIKTVAQDGPGGNQSFVSGSTSSPDERVFVSGSEPDAGSAVQGANENSLSARGGSQTFSQGAPGEGIPDFTQNQKVDWGEVENQLFGRSAPTTDVAPSAGGISPDQSGKAPLFPLDHPATKRPSENNSYSESETAHAVKDLPAPELPSFKKELEVAAEHLADKIKKYEELTKDLQLRQESTIKKTATKKVQKELMKEWRESDLRKQDDLRREFTKALFKKN